MKENFIQKLLKDALLLMCQFVSPPMTVEFVVVINNSAGAAAPVLFIKSEMFTNDLI